MTEFQLGMYIVSYFIAIVMCMGFGMIKFYEKLFENANPSKKHLMLNFLKPYIKGNFAEKVVFILKLGARAIAIILFFWIDFDLKDDNDLEG